LQPRRRSEQLEENDEDLNWVWMRLNEALEMNYTH